MTRLIVDDGGQRRAFKIQDGRLTVGSGPDATVRLATGDVADLHLDLEVTGGRVTLRPRAGVTAPKVNGVPTPGAVELAHGAAVQLGDATLRIEYDVCAEAPAGRAPSPAGVPKRPKGVVQTRRTRELHSSRGLPSWAVVVIVLVVVAVVGVFGSKVLTSKPTDNIGASASVLRVHEDLKIGNVEAAEGRLKGIVRDELDAATRAKYDEAVAAIAAARTEVDVTLQNVGGTEYLQTQLKNFESQRLAPKPDLPKVRVFVKRCDEFLERWPQHPERDWVERMKTRYSSLYDLSARPTFEDIAYEAETLTWANPRDYKQAIALVRTFADEEAKVDERPKALALLDELIQARAEWFTDRMLQARHEYEKGQVGQSVGWLVMMIEYTGDEAMQAQASEQLVKFDGLTEWLRGYRSKYPAKYEILRQQPAIAKYIATHDVE